MAEQPKTPQKDRTCPFTSVSNPPRLQPEGAQPSHHSFQPGTTPRSREVPGTEQFTTPTPDEVVRNQRYKILAVESRGHFVGPVDPVGFVKHFIIDQDKLDNEVSKVQTMPNIEWTGSKETMQEADMYKPIVNGATRFVKNKDRFLYSHDLKDTHRDDLLPDIIKYEGSTSATASKVDLSNAAECFIEVKAGKTFDPFVANDEKGSDRDQEYPFEAIADSRMINRGQILTYCTAIARSYSHRLGRFVLKPVNGRHEHPRFGDKIKNHKERENWRLFRMSLSVIGDRLATFKSTKELVTAIADAMEAHDAAYFDARILHRDISVGNILIHNGKGLLIDWDLCLPLDGVLKSSRRPQRTGTWQFMSAAILKDPQKDHEISDDRESAFHVLTWTALCYAKHNKAEPKDLREFLSIYDYSISAGTFVKGGQLKRHALTTAMLSEDVVFGPALDALIAELTDHLSARYFTIQTRDQSFLESLKKKITDLEQLPERTESQQERLETHREYLVNHPAYRLWTSRELLQTRGWLVKTMRRHIDLHDWPADDKACRKGAI